MLSNFDKAAFDLAQRNNNQIGDLSAKKAEKADLSTTNANVNATNSRLDNLINNVTTDAEVLDSRVSAAKNKTFTTVKNRFEEVEKDVNVLQSGQFTSSNIIKNGDFLDGTTSWTPLYSTISASGSSLLVTGTGQSATSRAGQVTDVNLIPGRKYYVRVSVTQTNKDANSIGVDIRDNTIGGNLVGSVPAIDPTELNVPYIFSNIITNSDKVGKLAITIISTYADTTTATGGIYEVKYPIVVDLTAMYGTGKEPTVEEFEKILANYPNKWFKGTVQVLTVQDVYKETQKEVDGQKIKTKAVTAKHVDFINENENIFNVNSSENIIGQYYAANKTLVSMNDTAITHKIAVSENDVIRFLDMPLFTTNFKGAMFDSKNQLVSIISTSTTNLTVTNGISQFTIPPNIAYIKLNFRPSATSLMIVKNIAYPSKYVKYALTIDNSIKINQSSVIQDSANAADTEYLKVIFNKALCIGDSLTQGHYYGDVTPRLISENYPYYLGKLTNWNVTNAGAAGYTTLQWWQSKVSQYTYTNYDVFVICLGTNGGFTDTLEVDTSTTPYADTNTGAYCKIIEKIKTDNPKANIFLTNIFSTSGPSLSIANNVINKIATKYSLPVLDINDGTLYGAGTEILHPNNNTVHFGKIGNLFLAKHILEKMTNSINSNLTAYNVPID